ncbi:hypothetical protein A2U01_0114772, partial [Trifolium medium]|nr:hypothetical protein [Trifolium medium]
MTSSDWLALFPVRRNFFKYYFKFENLWLKEEDVDVVVEEGWCREGDVEVTERVEACAD